MFPAYNFLTYDKEVYAKDKLNYFANSNEFHKSLNDTLSLFIDRNIKICETSPYNLSRQRKKNFDRTFENFSIEEKYKIKLISRLTYI